MTRSQKVWCALALGQLALVAMAVTQTLGSLERLGLVGKALLYYADLSGASGCYAFFAPGVEPQPRAVFHLTRSDGSFAQDRLEAGLSHEAELRVQNIVGMIAISDDDRRLRRSLVASWSAKILARHHDARSVLALVESYDLPTMEAYRRGVRGSWHRVYGATFRRQGEAR